ncbi:cytochrome P450 [Kordiimonas sediminis]|uniref:Cytochrome P450 n=1 Tax=Kordiimonas sediminis TaxID=1735581 RepID=A0A919ATR9_9PROT|nr:cytochrome P450 [Kordiimonas sediminis]GHF22785.1 cytochrome P450 [Kordiimonas sediminis]
MSDHAEQNNHNGPARLKDIPGTSGWPILGNTLQVLNNPEKFNKEMVATYGQIFRSNSFFQNSVNLQGPDANEFVLMDKGKNFSSEKGWGPWLEKLFPRGLMLMDFDHHKAHRHIMAAAFKTGPMKGYMERLNDEIPLRIQAWGEKKNFEFYPAIKQLSLELATSVFLGLENGPETNKVNTALTDMVQAAIGIVRVPIPGSMMYKGVKGRQFMVDFLARLIPERRNKPGDDIFTQLCQAQDEEGNCFTDQEIIDHMIFLWMAAHDTITSSVTTMVYELGRHTDWQDKLVAEIASLSLNDDRLPYEKMNDLVLTEYCFKEALRMNPPVPGMPRRTVREVEFGGYRIPANTIVSINPVATHRDPSIWDSPEKFDPMRFSPEGGVKQRHRYAWIPFGGGAHMCLGLHFAYMQAKVIMAHLLPHYRIELPEGYSTKFQIMPLIKPLDGLPVTLTSRNG